MRKKECWQSTTFILLQALRSLATSGCRAVWRRRRNKPSGSSDGSTWRRTADSVSSGLWNTGFAEVRQKQEQRQIESQAPGITRASHRQTIFGDTETLFHTESYAVEIQVRGICCAVDRLERANSVFHRLQKPALLKGPAIKLRLSSVSHVPHRFQRQREIADEHRPSLIRHPTLAAFRSPTVALFSACSALPGRRAFAAQQRRSEQQKVDPTKLRLFDSCSLLFFCKVFRETLREQDSEWVA